MAIVNYLHNLNNDIECQLCCTLFNENNYDECKDCHYKICNICYDNYINKYNYKNCPQCRMIIHQENNAVVDTNMDESLNINELPICDRFRCIFFIFGIIFCWLLGYVITGEYDPEYTILNFFCGLMIFTLFILLIISCCNH